jgi:hypothetical protein
MRASLEIPSQTSSQQQIQVPVLQPGTEAFASSLSSQGPGRSIAVSNAAASEFSKPGRATASANKPVSTMSGQTSPQAPAQPAHTASSGAPVEHGHPVASLPSGLVETGANPALLREPGGERGTIYTAANPAAESHGAAAPATRETFAALDAGTSQGTPTLVQAGAHRAEAGFQDPALGWVGVRAEASEGGVHAVVVPGSAEAAQSLSGHLAGLNAYLAEQHTPVESLTVAAPEGRWTESGTHQGANQSMHQGTGQDTEQSPSSGQQFSSQASTPALATATAVDPQSQAGSPLLTAEAVLPGGTHISVMA